MGRRWVDGAVSFLEEGEGEKGWQEEGQGIEARGGGGGGLLAWLQGEEGMMLMEEGWRAFCCCIAIGMYVL